MIIKPKHIPMKALALGCMLASAGAFAQIEEIVVTAEFRETNVQDTPLAITAVSGDMLEARNQTNLVQISAQAPNVNLNPAGVGNGPAMVAFIRGVGQTDFNYAVEPGVGIYVDDVYYPTLTGSMVDLFDVERLEVLRGPQGTLAGKNSIGGSIKLFSKKPGEEAGNRVSVTRGSYNRLDFSGAADLELSDTVWARISGVSKAEDGYVKRLDYACATKDRNFPTFFGNGDWKNCEMGTEGGRNVTGIRTAFRWQPSDSLDINIAYDHTNEDSDPAAGTLLSVDAAQAQNQGYWLNPFPVAGRSGLHINGLDGTRYNYDSRFIPSDPYTTYSTYIDSGEWPEDPNFPGDRTESTNPWAGESAIAPETTLEQNGWYATIDWDISDSLSFTSITSARRYYASWAQDADASPVQSNLLTQVLDHEQVSQEFRLSGVAFNDLLDYTLGMFYFDQDGTLNGSINIPYAGLNFIHGPDPTPSTTTAYFLNTAWHLTDRLNLTVGVRQSDEEKEYVFFRSNADGTIPTTPCNPGPPGKVIDAPNCAFVGFYNYPAEFEDSRTDYRVAVDYALTDDLMVYVQNATGYKGGGINPRPYFDVQVLPVAPEELDSYEFGFKTLLLDSNLRLNFAYFMNDYTDIQLQVSQCELPGGGFGAPCLAYKNAGDADVDGIELEAELVLGNLIVDFSYAKLDFEYTRLSDALLPPTIAPGTPAADAYLSGRFQITPFTPETSYSVGAQYTFNLSSGGDISARLDYNYKDDMYTRAVNLPANLIEGYGLLNGRIVWSGPDQNWEIFGELNNITDEVYYHTIYDVSENEGFTTGNIGKPKNWALGINYYF